MAEAVVIIPHYNDVLRLQRCLQALVPQLTPRVEVIVVDNGSSEPLDEVQARYPELRFVVETTKGAACARNRGVKESTAERLFFLDCDCVPDPDWLATAFQVAERADVVGGRITLFDESAAPRSGAEAFETVFAFHNRQYIEKKGFSVTANMLTTRSVFDATGPFVPGLSEDLDWCHRARAAGFGLAYVAALGVGHPTRGDWAALSRKWQRLTQEAFGVNGMTGRARLIWAAKALIMPLSVFVHAPRVLGHDALNGVGERVSALGTLARLRLNRAGWMLRQALTGTP